MSRNHWEDSLELFERDVCGNYHRQNHQSVLAHQKASKGADVLRKRILEALRWLKGATSEEVENLLRLPHQSVSPRMSELKRDGKIVKIGTRPTKSGSPAGVYKIV